jgi:hypothetical protein
LPYEKTHPKSLATLRAEVLSACRVAARSGVFSISAPAEARARAQGHSRADLAHALAGAIYCELSRDVWTVRGPSLDGAELELHVALAAGVIGIV